MWRGFAAFLVLAACVPPAAPPAPAGEEVAPGRVEPSPEVEPAEEVAAEPQPTEAEAEPKATPSSAGPSKKEATVATRSMLKGKLARLAPILTLPDGRAAVLWRHTAGEYACEASVQLVLLKQDEGEWSAEGVKEVVDSSTPWIDEDEPPPFAVTARTDDYDDDGEPEILVRVRYALMCPGGGPNTVTSLHIYDTTPGLDTALSTELHHLMDAYPEEETRATVKHEDLDGDGHRDVKIEYVSKPEGKVERATNTWLYTPARDAWTLTKPKYERWGCDW